MFAGNFAPVGYLFCQGQSLAIADYQPLFALIGTTYGGDGVNNFQLPDLRSRLAIHAGSDGIGDTYQLGQTGGQETVLLNGANLPFHNHPMQANNTSGSANATSGGGGTFGNTDGSSAVYGTGQGATLSPKAIGMTGGTQAHPNIKPFLSINFIIATEGIYPSRS